MVGLVSVGFEVDKILENYGHFDLIIVLAFAEIFFKLV
jgi:hypothetical protein